MGTSLRPVARFYLHIVGEDRAGIVAGVTRVLGDLDCNIEDSRMFLLQGQFSIGLVVNAPGTWDGAVIEAALAPVMDALDLGAYVRPMPQLTVHAPMEADSEMTIAIEGGDHPGIVARLSAEISRHGATIEDLVGHLFERGGVSSYRMTITCLLPKGDDGSALAADLDAVSSELGVECRTTTRPAPAPEA